MAMILPKPAEPYENPHISIAGMIAVIWIEAAIAGLFVAGREWVRRKQTKRLFIDDCWVLLAIACLIAMCGLYVKIIPLFYAIIDVANGVEAVPDDIFQIVPLFLKTQFAIIILFWTNVWAVKASFLAFYRGLFDPRIQMWKIREWWAVVLICALSYIGCWISQFLSCQPFGSYFGLGTCETAHDLFVSNTSLFFSSAVDIACDILIMVLPLSILPRLQMDRKKKLALVGMFSVGLVIIVFAVLRLIKTRPNGTHVNPEWLCIMSVTEGSVAVMVSCAPPLRKMFTNSSADKPHDSSSRVGKTNRSNDTDESESTVGFAPMLPGHELEEANYARPEESNGSGRSSTKDNVRTGVDDIPEAV